MPNLEIILAVAITLLGIRTLSWHLQCWQLREYRYDRMRAWLKTQDGKNYFIPWIFKGMLPRPKFSGRVLLILSLVFLQTLVLSAVYILVTVNCGISDFYFPDSAPHCSNQTWWNLAVLLFWERTLWLQTALAVLISSLPVKLKKLHLFHQASKVVRHGSPNIVRIGITGSYGKSSTKELLVHLLKAEFGDDAVLYNPANNNTEVAIARLILKHKSFFQSTPSAPRASPPKPRGEKNRKFLVIETGAYRQGEIGTVSKMIQPQFSILTGLNEQHIELFGSIQNTRDAKFELAEGTLRTVFFNGDNDYLNEIFSDRKIKATNMPISFKAAQNVKSLPRKSTFNAYGQEFTLPWPGQFFVHNALLALELCREIGVPPAQLAKHLSSLAPLERAMSLEVKPSGLTVLRDTYSANPDGVLSAIDHLKNFKGRKIFVSIPLRELGSHAETIHQQIFEALRTIKAEVYWGKTDFSDLGEKVLGDRFHLIDENFERFKKDTEVLKKDDVVLLESKLSQKILDLFR